MGAIEIKASWAHEATAGAYQFTGTTGTYSLLGLHIMAKMKPTPAEPFLSEDPSWFWTTFEFKGNPGLANAESLLAYKDALSPAEAMNLLTQAGLSQMPFANYKCNGTQIRFSDATNKKIVLGNTQMEPFGFTPAELDRLSGKHGMSHAIHAMVPPRPTRTTAVLFFPFERKVQVREGGGPIRGRWMAISR